MSREALESKAYDGLECMFWETQANGDLRVQVFNFDGPCTTGFRPAVTESSDARQLNLIVEDPSCLIGRCGRCLYDLDFVVSDPVAAGLRIKLGWQHCPSQPEVEIERELTLSGPVGGACRYAGTSAFESQMRAEERCGSAYSQCPAVGACAGEPCADGLRCVVPTGGEGQRCLAPCTTDQDCAPSDMSMCVGRVCTVPPFY